MKKVKAAIIGTGSIAATHAKGYKKAEGCELYACCDVNRERAENFARLYGIEHVYCNQEELFACEELDAVSVCTWNAAHFETAMSALRAGKNVICEKPMALNAEEALRMREYANECGKLLMVGLVRRFGSDARLVKDFAQGGSLGEIYYAKATYIRRHGFPGGWFGNRERAGGGPLLDIGTHVIDLCRYLMGNPRPVSVYGFTSHKLGAREEIKKPSGTYLSSVKSNFEFNVEDLAAALIRFDNGSVINLETSYDLNTKGDYTAVELFGTRGGVKIDPEVSIYTDLDGYMVDITPSESAAFDLERIFEQEIAHFVDCVANAAVCISSADDGAVIMQIIDAVYQSAQSGHEVLIK